jgi:hypothetical protein
VSSSIKLADASFDDMRCDTGRDGGCACRHYTPLIKPTIRSIWNWYWAGNFTKSHGCTLFGYELEATDTETAPVVTRCLPCKSAFGYRDMAPALEAFDVPIDSIRRSEPRVFDTIPAPRRFDHPTLRAVDKPTFGASR